jgi:hypothetical protein
MVSWANSFIGPVKTAEHRSQPPEQAFFLRQLFP